MSLLHILIPLISATTGWVTIWITTKLLFHPRKPLHIAGFTLQGVLPKNQRLFANKVGELVYKELASSTNIENQLSDPKNLDALVPEIELHIDNFLREKLKVKMPMVSMFLGENTILQFKTIFMEELKELFPVLITNYVGSLKSEFDIKQKVIDKVSAFSMDRAELVLNKAIGREFRMVYAIGAIVGFLIGLVQVGLILSFD